MALLQLFVNDKEVQGLTGEKIKASLTNVSPVSMTGDSKTYTATLKAPRCMANDLIFDYMSNPFVDKRSVQPPKVELLIDGIQFGGTFGCVVTMSESDYSINLVDQSPKFADFDVPIIKYAIDYYVTNPDYIKLPDLIRKHIPNFNYDRVRAGSDELVPAIRVDKPTATTSFVEVINGKECYFKPMWSIKNSNGWDHQNSEFWIGDQELATNIEAFTSLNGGAFKGTITSSWFLIQTTDPADTLPAKLTIVRYNGTSWNTMLTIARNDSWTPSGTTATSNHIAMYFSPYSSEMTITAPFLKLGIAHINNSTPGRFKFADGYPPEQVLILGLNNLAATTQATMRATLPGKLGYTNIKNLVDDLSTAHQWRKVYDGKSLYLQNVVHEAIQTPPTTLTENPYVDWSSKFRAFDSCKISDEFACSVITKVGSSKYSAHAFLLGHLNTNFVKEGFTSGLPTGEGTPQYLMRVGSSIYSYVASSEYWQKLQRFYNLFAPMTEYAIKAKLTLRDFNTFRPDFAYYFAQLNKWFYIKTIGELDVTTGDCKITMYELDLNNRHISL